MMKFVLLLIVTLLSTACGVKGDPLPPEVPAEIGRGKPTYKRAFEKVKLPSDKLMEDEDESEEGNKDEEE